MSTGIMVTSERMACWHGIEVLKANLAYESDPIEHNECVNVDDQRCGSLRLVS
jgi:hypothetical protein